MNSALAARVHPIVSKDFMANVKLTILKKPSLFAGLVAAALCITFEQSPLRTLWAAEFLAANNAAKIESGEMAGYLLVPHEKVPESFNAGFSLYVAAWPLVKDYPGDRFQTGLFGTWMFAQNEPSASLKKEPYSDIEGGLGWWRDTRFATETPKFIMGGVAPEFSEWANGPGAGKGRDWDKPQGKYGVAQLSPWVLWPPDGLNLKQGTSGQLFGYGYLPLPLTQAKPTTLGKDVPTGDHSWTLFLNTNNFKGPVTFFTPHFWSRETAEHPEWAGRLLDSRPSQPNKALQMETQHVPSILAVDDKGVSYARVAPTRFPVNAEGRSVMVHRLSAYNKDALWNSVKTWFDGGAPVEGTINPAASSVHHFKGTGGATWEIYSDRASKEDKAPLAWTSFATPMALDPMTFGFQWNEQLVTKTRSKDGGALITLPEYFQRITKENKKPQWIAVAAESMPASTGLLQSQMTRPDHDPLEAYVTPNDPESCWKKPGPVAGPFQVRPNDGSVVTYFWYRFADQPAILNADLTDAEREALQVRVEKLHRHWKQDRDYLPPPTLGTLAEIEPALLVTPPARLEVGYVPIVTRQEAAK